MISNPGFSFSNVIGKHHIDSLDKANLDNLGALYSEAIVCTEQRSIIQIYSHYQNPSSESGSIALQFSEINIDNIQEILDFCDHYGLINSERIFANFRNDYIFLEENKSDFSKKIPLPHKERMYLTDFKKAVAAMRLLLELSSAIHDRDFDTIVKIITFFCFDLTVHDYEGSTRATELFQFNHAFYRYAEDCGYVPFNYESLDYSDMISSFLESIHADEAIEKSFNKNGFAFPRHYPQSDYSEWLHLRALFDDLLSVTDIQSITPYGEVLFNPPLSAINYLISLKEDQLLNLAKAVLSDLFKENLHRISPEIQYENNQLLSSWRIPSLLSAMYLELFFRFSPYGQIKICANPTCKKAFTWTSSKPTKKFCCTECAVLMAKRNQRKRERERLAQNKSQKTSSTP